MCNVYIVYLYIPYFNSVNESSNYFIFDNLSMNNPEKCKKCHKYTFDVVKFTNTISYPNSPCFITQYG